MIDLHTHTTASDGTALPSELIRMALQNDLEALAITDHDTLEGWDEASPVAAELHLDLVAGIELSTRLEQEHVGRFANWLGSKRLPSIHLLGYFLKDAPSPGFREWILSHQESRRQRNIALIEKLRGLGMEITLAEVSALGGKLTGRPHFAQFLLSKGYVKTRQEAFDLYLADDAKAAVEREEPGLLESIAILRQGGGTPVLAHPGRLPFGEKKEALGILLEVLCGAGLRGLEVWHSEHSASQVELFEDLARSFGLERTGGSDFHGGNKPSIMLGSGINGNVRVPKDCLDRLRAAAG